jgi:hypothetical protein
MEKLMMKKKLWRQHVHSARKVIIHKFIELGSVQGTTTSFEMGIQEESLTCFLRLVLQRFIDVNGYADVKVNDWLPRESRIPSDELGSLDILAIPETDWKQAEIIGWLYQYYIEEDKSNSFHGSQKYSKTDLPYVTQLFTPAWIAHYLAQNGVGRYWLEAHPEDIGLKRHWPYYHDTLLEGHVPASTKLRIEDMKCLDPAMGCGHILLALFETLYVIYEQRGYAVEDIPGLIVENNLYGLDIDSRTTQIARFMVAMKALEYNRDFIHSASLKSLFRNIISIEETNELNDQDLAVISDILTQEEFDEVEHCMTSFRDAKIYGSLLRLQEEEWNDEVLETCMTKLEQTSRSSGKVRALLPGLIQQARILRQSYDVIATNPPYLGRGRMNEQLSLFLKQYYPDSKSDTSAAFMEWLFKLKRGGLMAMINSHSWMYLTSLARLRTKLLERASMVSMIHLGTHAFEEIRGEVVQTTAFVIRNRRDPESAGDYIRLVPFKDSADKERRLLQALHDGEASYRYRVKSSEFVQSPGQVIAYHTAEGTRRAYSSGQALSKLLSVKQGLITGNVKRFVRHWFEVPWPSIGFHLNSLQTAAESEYSWFPYQYGGEYRKWYGNHVYVVNWRHGGAEIKNYRDEDGKQRSRIQGMSYYFQPGATWTAVSSSQLSVRAFPQGFIFSNAGMAMFGDEQQLMYAVCLLNSKAANVLLMALNESLNYNQGDLAQIPLLPLEEKDARHMARLYHDCVAIAREEWDSDELSWDFRAHPVVRHKGMSDDLAEAYQRWSGYADEQYELLRRKEEELNRLFIRVYGLQSELLPDLKDPEMTLRRSDRKRDIRALLSYAVGCMFGRYSLNQEGIVYAGGAWEEAVYGEFAPVTDNVVPLSYHGNDDREDIVTLLIRFLGKVFDTDSLAGNLEFIADAIGRKKGQSAEQTIRGYFDNEFYKDHLSRYGNKPIYWLLSSGKHKAFQCLIYIHRYEPSLWHTIRMNDLRVERIRVEEELRSCHENHDHVKRTNLLKLIHTEIMEYDSKLERLAESPPPFVADDGIAVHYEKLREVLAPRLARSKKE